MAVRHPGYYSGWLHVVADIPASTNMINLYQWISDWTANNYNYRWTGAGKKLNAILTIQPGTILSARHKGSIDTTPSTVNEDAAIFIKSDGPVGGDSFRSFDRITIINKGTIMGAYGDLTYDGEGSFTPPVGIQFTAASSQFKYKPVTSVDLHSYGTGGTGGAFSTAQAGGGGSGGNGGYRDIKNGVTVTAGIQVVSSESSGTYSYSQNGFSKSSAGPGATGGAGAGNGCYECQRSWTVYLFGTRKHNIEYCNNAGIGGVSNKSGSNTQYGKSGTGGGQCSGSKSGDGFWGAATSGCCGNYTGGAVGGAGGPGHTTEIMGKQVSGGGKGGTRTGASTGTAATNGQAGTNEFRYKRTEMYGPAIITNRKLLLDSDEGYIFGGYDYQHSTKPRQSVTSWTKPASRPSIVGGSNKVDPAQKSGGVLSKSVAQLAGTRIFNSTFSST